MTVEFVKLIYGRCGVLDDDAPCVQELNGCFHTTLKILIGRCSWMTTLACDSNDDDRDMMKDVEDLDESSSGRQGVWAVVWTVVGIVTVRSLHQKSRVEHRARPIDQETEAISFHDAS